MSGDLVAPNINEQIAELRRELKMRERVYPKHIQGRRLTPKKAAYQVACLEATVVILETLGLCVGMEWSADDLGRMANLPRPELTINRISPAVSGHQKKCLP